MLQLADVPKVLVHQGAPICKSLYLLLVYCGQVFLFNVKRSGYGFYFSLGLGGWLEVYIARWISIQERSNRVPWHGI